MPNRENERCLNFVTVETVLVGVAGVPELVVGLLDALAAVVIADHAVRTLVQPLLVVLAHVFSQLALSISEKNENGFCDATVFPVSFARNCSRLTFHS